jgi:hypothetical protein
VSSFREKLFTVAETATGHGLMHFAIFMVVVISHSPGFISWAWISPAQHSRTDALSNNFMINPFLTGQR